MLQTPQLGLKRDSPVMIILLINFDHMKAILEVLVHLWMFIIVYRSVYVVVVSECVLHDIIVYAACSCDENVKIFACLSISLVSIVNTLPELLFQLS